MKATGILSWPPEERRSDRYGMIGLYQTGTAPLARALVELDLGALAALHGRRCRITARVLETRQSGHVGDLFRGIKPRTPEVGQCFDLGAGKLVVDTVNAAANGAVTFGLEPDDGRRTDWFDPHTLYALHDQTVEVSIDALQ